ncbi:hypothetical protein AaE_015995 [Aphanomyces astaci]|uniref:Core-binding (CB) domain-containing protein n=1 Tax=Aphanomyces astaci TaxID=112090 RepID=A0A6A4YYA1_APHAT|nr:hypothetical protein AaE_015995 [Aphanomyces astaci]
MAPATILQRQDTSLEDIIDSCLADSTKERYESGLRQIIKWIHVTGGTHLLKDDGTVDLRVFQYDNFVQFIVWVYQHTPVKVGTMSGYRAALRWYYKREDVAMFVEYETKLKTIFTGLQRLTATNAHMFEALCTESLKSLDSCFAHLFLVISWNLMARSKSTETIHLDHISFEEDAVGVTYFKSKTDQSGSKRRDPKHIYANPSSPAICSFLALGIYFACNPTMATGALFPGARQRDRFGKALKALAHAVLGSTANGTVGTHSIRKGAATFVCSGSTSGPSVISVCIRCGWSLGNVVERPSTQQRWLCSTAPHFDATDSATVTNAVRYMFPRLSKNVALLGVLKLGLASLVFHADYLRSTLPASHAVLHTAIFRDDELRVKLRSLLRSSSATLALTGLPPYVELYRQLKTQHETLKALSTEVVAGVRGIWDEKELSAGTVTQAYIDRHFSTILERLGGGGNSADVVPAQPPPRRREHMLFAWGGRLHKLLEHFCFPSVDVTTA